jgi:peptidoglycan/LPS O-acetylase OafA/YrhL
LFEKADEVTSAVLATTWVSIVVLFGQDLLSVHEPYHFMLPVRQSWSIASELLFYVMVPLLFRHMTLKMCLVGFAVLMGVKLALLRGYDWRASYFFPVGNFGYFLLGYGAYLISVHPAVEAFKTRYRVVMKRGVLLLILVMLTFFGEASFERSGYLHHFIMVGVFTTGCVLMFERAVSRLDLLLGNLAYGIYLNHFLLIVVLGQVIGTSISKTGFVCWVIATSFLMAFFMEKSIQGPIDRWRRARTGFARQS